MGRTYAGVLGCLAFATTVARGLIHGSGFQSTVVTAITGMIAFAIVGAVLGSLAEWIVTDSIRSSVGQAVQPEAQVEK